MVDILLGVSNSGLFNVDMEIRDSDTWPMMTNASWHLWNIGLIPITGGPSVAVAKPRIFEKFAITY